MNAAILAVGSELLGTERLDTNSLRLTGVLERYGVELVRKGVLGDREDLLADEVSRLLEDHDLVLVTGGLGPTSDDVTREAAAAALGREMVRDPELEKALEERFRSMGRTMAEANRKQADVPEGGEPLANDRGSAPGLRIESEGGATLFLFPGVPRELEGMIETYLEPWLAERTGGVSREMVTLKVALVPESDLEERLRPAYEEFGREAISVLSSPGDITVQATASGDAAERRERLEAMADRLAELAGVAVYAREETDLETVVGALFAERGLTLVTAESCTGGLVAERLTRVPGSSAYFLGAAVTYSNPAKRAVLGVAEDLLATHGAVSEPVARAMADGAREALGGDWAVALTGIAGPGGGSEDKPVGTVHVAWSGPGGRRFHRRVRLPGGREMVRRLSSQVALEGLRRILLELPGWTVEPGSDSG